MAEISGHLRESAAVSPLDVLRFPGVVVGRPDRHVVWGLTFRFLDRMLSLLDHPFERTWGNVEHFRDRFEREQDR